MSARRRLVVANWKMHKTPAEGAAFALDLIASGPPPVDLAVAPAFPALESVGRALIGSGITLAAQDVHGKAAGAHTGEVSALMLHALGVELAIVGHSERRRDRGEDEAAFSAKMWRLAEHAIAPLYCVGETLEEREAGKTAKVLASQLAALDGFESEPPKGLALAYEPVWAIGTGRSATPAIAAEAHALLRSDLAARFGGPIAMATRILYGGSVTARNAGALFAEVEIDGALVGGASLEVEGFLAIAAAAAG